MINKIGIIVPIFNVGEFLPYCLNSILTQNYTNWECFLVNDGSTDNSKQIIEKFCHLDHRFHSLDKKNGGLSSARNYGLDYIFSKKNDISYISFLDSDDIILPDFYKTLYNLIYKTDADLATCGYFYFGDQVKYFKNDIKEKIINSNDFIKIIYSLGEWRQYPSGGMVWKCLYKKNLLTKIRFCENNSILEDEMFCFDIAAHANRIIYTSAPLYAYRQRTQSLSKQQNIEQRKIEGRKLNIKKSKNISKLAYYTAISGYIDNYIYYIKNHTEINPEKIPVSFTDILLSYHHHFFTLKKLFFACLLNTYIPLFKVFREARKYLISIKKRKML